MLHLNLLGDSHFVRFYSHLHAHLPHPYLRVDSLIAKSGITISELKSLIKQRQPIFHAKTVTVVFIASNDIQRKYTFDRIKTDFLSLVKFIKKRLPTDALLVFTTLP